MASLTYKYGLPKMTPQTSNGTTYATTSSTKFWLIANSNWHCLVTLSSTSCLIRGDMAVDGPGYLGQVYEPTVQRSSWIYNLDKKSNPPYSVSCGFWCRPTLSSPSPPCDCNQPMLLPSEEWYNSPSLPGLRYCPPFTRHLQQAMPSYSVCLYSAMLGCKGCMLALPLCIEPIPYFLIPAFLPIPSFHLLEHLPPNIHLAIKLKPTHPPSSISPVCEQALPI